MKKKIMSIVLCAALLMGAAPAPTEENVAFPLSADVYEIINTTDLNELKKLIEQCNNHMNTAHEMAEAARNLSYEEEHAVIILAQQEYEQAKTAKKHYEELYAKQEKIEKGKRFFAKSNEYPVAAEVWAFLHTHGYSDAVTAGILGNMMSECGGQTLALQPHVYSPSGNYYGLAQWNKQYGLHGATLYVQLNYLCNSLEETFNRYGKLYKTGFDYNDFCNLQSPEEACKAFLYVYERGAHGTVSKRQKNARIAYNYFIN